MAGNWGCIAVVDRSAALRRLMHMAFRHYPKRDPRSASCNRRLCRLFSIVVAARRFPPHPPPHHSPPMPADLTAAARAARDRLDSQVYEIVQWHFHPSTGCPFWLEMASRLKFDPLKEVKNFDDLKKFPPFEDEWLRGGPVRRWVPKAFADKPIYVFETGGTTGMPKSRVAIEDFRIDYSLFSETLPDEYFPKGSNWLMLGPSGPRRLRLAVEHLAQHRGGICFCIDLDPRWVDQAHQARLDGASRSVQAALHRPGDHDPHRRPRHPLHVHHAQAARIAGPGAGEAGLVDPQVGHHRHLFRRHRVHAAMDPLRHRRVSGRRLHDADLRQHADGPGLPRSRSTRRRRLQDHATTPRSRGP